MERVERLERQPGDFLMVLLVIVLIGIGLAMLFSASYEKSAYYFVFKQAVWIVLGGLLGFVVSNLSLELLKKSAPWLILLSLLLMLLTFIPGIGSKVLGGRRWIIFFGLSFQPSEFVKLSLLIYLAAIFSKKEQRITEYFSYFFPPFLVVCLFVGLTFLQNDFSTAVFIFFIAMLVFYIARVRFIYFLLLGIILIGAVILVIFTSETRTLRMISFLAAEQDPLRAGYQVLQAKQTFYSGGFWGRGLGLGVKKLSLPYAYNDFIFPVIGEELGFIGLIFVLILYGLMAFRGYRIAWQKSDSFHFFLGFGITSMLAFQTLLNMLVSLNLMPTTGIPLPFFSAGGSSMLISLVMVGLLINLSRQPNSQRGYYSV